MKRHKNLERAIVLGLMLSTGIYGTAFAETMNSGLWTDADKEVEAGEDLTINASGVGIGFDGTVNVMDGDLTVNATSNGILSGYGKDMQVQILANNVKIDADDNGIFTTWGDSILDSLKGYSGKVIIGSSDRNIDSLDITSGGQGIDNKWGKVEIYGKENSTINIHSTGTSGDDPNQAAINNSGSGDKGIVNVNGGDISLRADKGNGITNGSGITTINSNKTVINASVNGVENSYGTTTINGKDITINSKQNAVHNTGSGTINITSKGITQEGVSTLDDQYGYDISLVGEEENGILSDGTGTTNVIADNDIIIAGKENGILSNKDGQINVTAGNNNVIGQYTDEEGTQHTSQTGINVSSGTVTITSGNKNNIYGTQNGILVTGEKSNVILDGKINNITVINDNDSNAVNGLYSAKGSSIKVENNNSTGIITQETKIITINNGNNNYGIHADENGTIDITTGRLDIETTNNATERPGNAYGILAGKSNNADQNNTESNVIVNAINDVNVTATGDKASAITANKDGHINIVSEYGDVNLTTIQNSENVGSNFGIKIADNASVDIQAKMGSISVVTGNEMDLEGNNFGVSVGENEGGNVTLTAGKDISINSYSKGQQGAQNGAILINQNSKMLVNTGSKDIQGNLIINTKSAENLINSTNTGIATNGAKAIFEANISGEIEVNSEGYNSYAIRADNGSASSYGEGYLTMNADKGMIVSSQGHGGYSYGVYTNNSINTLKSKDNISITANNTGNWSWGISTNANTANAEQILEAKNVIVSANNDNGLAYGINAQYNYYNNNDINNDKLDTKALVDVDAEESIQINANAKNNQAIGILSTNSDIDIDAKKGSTIINAIAEGDNYSAYGIYIQQNLTNNPNKNASTVNINSGIDNLIYGTTTGVYAGGTEAKVDVIAQTGVNIVQSIDGIALRAQSGAKANLEAENAYNVIFSDKATGIYSKGTNTQIDLLAKGNSIVADTGIWSLDEGNVELKAIENNNEITANSYGIYADSESIVDLKTISGNNNIYANVTTNEQGFGSGHAIQAASASNVDLNAIDGDNSVSGVIYAKGENTKVNLTHKISEQDESKGSNIILSSAHGTEDRTDVVAAVYAQSNGEVNIVAGKDGYNYIATDATLTNDKDREQTVWAQQGGKINIDGQTTIVASNADVNTNNIGDNSLGIAITAGTGDISGLEELPPLNTTQDGNEIRSTVNITNASGSSITGDIVSGYGGLINIGMDVNNKTRAAGTVENIKITGNALAANGGKLNINLGNGGTWTGRADDYGDAGYGPDAENHQNFYNPAFSNDILEGGTVNLTMGDNSTWKVQGQSWITSVDTTNAQNATIDLVEANTDRNTTSHALTIYDLKGNANINMNLDGNRDVSDMLYVKNAQGEYNVALADAVTTEDMYANGLDGLRFATVGAGSNVRFNAGSYDAGVFNVEYEVGTDAYDGNDENVVYNGNSLDVEKPGTSTVDSFFGYQGEDPNAEENTSEIATYARMAEEPQVMALAEEPVTETTATTKEATATGATNYKLIARKGESLSDAGKTILNMSKANYSQAVYLDTLNKRLGEARYLEGDEGLWVRMRHDKIDKDSSYEITNNMYELGYDKKYESKDKQGYHRRGVAIDYMDGDTSYDDIAGGGETNRKGIWLYDTWIGNKGHYTDYVAKWGHLENSFDLYTKTRGEKVSGDYDNDVYSLSAEWGYKDPLKNGWYFEPQAQLQYARVTGADYETSQGTQVSVDGIDSLIARAGFRLGKDFGEEKKSTFYVKADILHEFLGDQDISVLDKTTDGKITSIGYDNDGTWYSVGLGFSTMLSDNSYAFLDVEKIFGNDNDNSYQINGGFNWLL